MRLCVVITNDDAADSAGLNAIITGQLIGMPYWF